MGAITIGEIWTSIPFGVLLLASGFNGVPDSLIEAARDAGASLPRAIVSVLVPMSVIPIVIVTTFTSISVMGSFTVPYMTGPSSPNMLGVTMTNYFQSFNQPQQAEVMAVIVFVVAAAIGVFYVRANIRSGKRSGATS
jgi:ABC-type spermidine/putrescine transport system permease subunit I